MDMSDKVLTLHEAIQLGYTLASQFAVELGVRALAIKGPVLALQGIRAPVQSADIDLLVDPTSYAGFLAYLSMRGWAIMPHTAASALPHHSRTASHQAWPCELDIHDRYPGLSLPEQLAFDRLWVARSHLTIAARQLLVPSRDASTVMHGLHLIRDFGMSSAQVLEFAQELDNRLGSTERESLAECAAELGAADTLRPILSRLGAPPIGIGTTPQDFLRSWRVVSQSSGEMSIHVVAEAARTPVTSWARLLRQNVWLTDDEISWRYPDLAERPAGLLRARLLRLCIGLLALPRALRSYYLNSKEGGHG